MSKAPFSSKVVYVSFYCCLKVEIFLFVSLKILLIGFCFLFKFLLFECVCYFSCCFLNVDLSWSGSFTLGVLHMEILRICSWLNMWLGLFISELHPRVNVSKLITSICKTFLLAWSDSPGDFSSLPPERRWPGLQYSGSQGDGED